jgi:uncharacterized cupin superfamily protein
MIDEAQLKQTDEGLVPGGDGWFVVNARDVRWVERDGRGFSAPFTGWTDEEAEGLFPMLGFNLVVLGPGEPQSIYHRETDAEAFLVVAGEALLLVEGEARRLKQWDFFHCPPGCEHTIVGAGEGRCVIVSVSSRVNMGTDDWGAYTVDEVALKHGAGVEEETIDAGLAYARWKDSQAVTYGGWLPGD